MVQGAVYDAVNAIDRGHRAYLLEPPAAPTDSKDAAAATAAHDVLVALFPLQQRHAGRPLPDVAGRARRTRRPAPRPAAIAAGQAAAQAMLAARTNDGRGGPFTPVIGTTPGVWRPTPPLFATDPAAVGRQRPPVPGARRRDAPHARPQPADQPRVRERLQRGQGGRRAAQHDAAPPIRPTPRSSGRTTPSRSGTACSAPSPPSTTWTSPTAPGCSPARTWPPRTRRSAAGTTSTTTTPGARSPPSARPTPTATGPPHADPGWTPLFDPATPVAAGQPRSSPRRSPRTPRATTARPARSCGRCATSSAPTRSAFTATSNKSGTTRTFHRLSDVLKENINARVWAGIHFRTADRQGARLGKRVARYLHRHDLQPVD